MKQFYLRFWNHLSVIISSNFLAYYRYLDRIVISSKSFPMKYWDKFVRRKTRQKFREQIDEETLNAILGEDKSAGDNSFDYRWVSYIGLCLILLLINFIWNVGGLVARWLPSKVVNGSYWNSGCCITLRQAESVTAVLPNGESKG